MKEVYVCPQAEVISFMPNRAIALDKPGWGYEEDVFSVDDSNYYDEEGGDNYES